MPRTIPLICPINEGPCVDEGCKKGKCKEQEAEESSLNLAENAREKKERALRELLGDD